MKHSLFLLTLAGFILTIHTGQAKDYPAPSEAKRLSAGTPILCGVPPKSAEVIIDSTALSKEAESLDLLLEALSPKRSQQLEKMINQGTLEELVAIDGIAEGRAKTIIAERPYGEVKELMLIKGFGYATVASVIMHGSHLKP
ncbi:hypothetical protein N9B73_10855 [Verrucomicrobiales bacterium]|mgnify:CR=1 FL=1|nr:hypothetical protein [Verrucomicrobiales bacterium]|tara:strand:+ start:141 stop:566 length:426 start_codon:yes stop_codon:yes gene_type:complete